MQRLFSILVLLALLCGCEGAFSRRRASQPPPELLRLAEERNRAVLLNDPKIFGLDMLGWGIDLAIGKPEEAVKVPVFRWEYEDANTYIYPLEPNTTFQVPDDVYVRTVAEMFATNKVFESGKDFVTDLLLNLGVSIASSNSTAPPSNSTSSNNGTAPGTADINAVDLSAFSGSANIRYQYLELESQRNILIANTLESGLWQLVVGPSSFPRPRVRDNINSAQNESLTDSPYLPFARFVDRHGTHYIESVIVGGNLEMTSLIGREDGETLHDLSILANANFRNMFGLGELEVDLTVNFTDKVTSFTEDSNNWMKAQGGDPELANFFSGNLKPEETFVLWSKTLISNPAVIRFRLREISWLFDLPFRAAVRDAVTAHLDGSSPFSPKRL